ncbi:MAG: DNA cytosine methyltransferase [Roseiarcus sp.]|jgi:hypothetical protein
MHQSISQHLGFIDVFAGCGGLSLGLAQAGFKGLFAIECNECAFATFNANFLAKDARHTFEWPVWLPKAAIGIAELLAQHEKQLSALEGTVVRSIMRQPFACYPFGPKPRAAQAISEAGNQFRFPKTISGHSRISVAC